ncbi:hypothetical protein PFY12_10745 [Chryseobacterium camelliae]|uniref:SMODS-associating 2TM beta-strand rich effector domain-containing protein n=1 Tax=Chryseobacterium camelliae TaxID=1265445 RepID=A0ABY7QJS1_9FLAO|nr:hypothetical protein [Chryseobacterium camelliae]WBV59533.1 hypothetical protein PFY12_10745 [Chryseobacterium camelliae]
MKTLNLNILTIVNILFYSRMALSLICGFALLIFFGKNGEIENFSNIIIPIGIVFLGLLSGLFGVTLLKKIIIPRSKYPLVLNLLCNMKGLGKPEYYGSLKFDINNIIKDNKLRLTLYYINNPQYPILTFNKEKIIYFTQEYNWDNFNWSYKTIPQGRNEKQVLEFRGINQNNTKIKDNIEFEKIDAKENEILLLFIIHDLLFGPKASYYY